MGKRRVWKGMFPNLELKAEIRGGGGEIQLRNYRFRFVPQICWGVILLSMSKIIPPNGSCAHDAVGIGGADQCRYFLICVTMCPRLAPAANFA